MKTESKRTKIGVVISYLYLLLPFLIFAIGWFGKRYWILMAPILLFCYYKACKDTPAFWRPEFNRDNVIKIILVILVIAAWVYFSGIGAMVFQNEDHNARNAIYETLVGYDWPIINYDVIADKVPEGTTATSLIYYIGFWLPSAVIGKIFGVSVGYGFQVFWAILGIVLVYYFICARKEKLVVWPLAILIFFSGLDIVGQYLRGENLFLMTNDAHIEWWVPPYQYSSMTTQLFWVFNQAIPAWLCTILACVQKNNRSIVLILACCMLPGTFPFVGLLVLTVYWMFARQYDLSGETCVKGKLKKWWPQFRKDTFSIQNVVGGGLIGIFSFIYLISNVAGSQFMAESVHGASYDNHLLKYVMFIILEVGVYLIVLYQYNKKNGLYYVILLSLLIIPPFKVGLSGDFCMRASIPALFMLMLLVIDALEEAGQKKDRLILVSLIVLLGIGSITPLHEITRTFKGSVERFNAEEQIYETPSTSESILNSKNFSGPINDNFFFKYIAR